MRKIPVNILYYKNRTEEQRIVKQTIKAVETASQITGVGVEIEITYFHPRNKKAGIDYSNTPLLFIDDSVEFNGATPPVDLIRQKLESLKRMSGPPGNQSFNDF